MFFHNVTDGKYMYVRVCVCEQLERRGSMELTVTVLHFSWILKVTVSNLMFNAYVKCQCEMHAVC